VIKSLTSYLVSLIVFYCFDLKAQVNLVPNPNFEQYIICPTNVGEVFQAVGWSSYANSPDYFHFCGGPCVSVPDNCFGSQSAASGNAYVGYYGGGPGDNYREYIGIQLTNSLSIGIKYFVSFKISRSNIVGPFSNSTNKQGVLFSTVSYSASSPAPMNNFAHVFNGNIIADSLNWTTIFGSFISDSAYQYIALGNFYDDANTDFNGSQYSYYYIDNVCASTDSSYAATWTGIDNPDELFELSIYPTLFSSSIMIKSDLPYDIEIYNALGQKVLIESNIESTERGFDLSHFSNGQYYVKIVHPNEVSRWFKLLKI
jgi:hypothetical protein